MQKKKENFLEKIVQKDYNNELEKVIETKDFDENVKNLLLNILYKVEVSYKDYKTVKRDVESKQEYIEKIVKIIENKCNKILIPQLNSKEMTELGNRTFLVDADKKQIICYPIERKLLYCIAKIDKKQEIIREENFLIHKTLSDVINIGNNINTVEPLRDFNGFSWLIIKKEIENISYNLIYQNLRILIGDNFLESWIKNTEYLIDYYSELKNELKIRFGEKNEKDLIEILNKLSVVLELEINPNFEKQLKEQKQEIEKRLSEFKNMQLFIEKITQEKKEINKKIKKIENIVIDQELLQHEYKTRNQKLPLEKKIFSQKVLKGILNEEKIKLLEELEEKNNLLNPVKFVEEKTKLQEKYELLKIVDIQERVKEKNKILEDFQNIFLKCFLIFINNANSKEETINLFYKYRYYNMLPFNEEIDIYQNMNLNRNLKQIEKELFKKANEFKIINTFSEDLEDNNKVYSFIFKTKIISIEDIYVAIIKEKNKYYIEFSEDNNKTYEEKFEIENLNTDKLKIKLSKKLKIFI